MEPVRWGRDDVGTYAADPASAAPQWSPSAGDGTTRGRPGVANGLRRPQWSPSAGDGTTSEDGEQKPQASQGRNGARPLGTGRRRCRPWSCGRPPLPQWSPSAGDGTTDDLLTVK